MSWSFDRIIEAKFWWISDQLRADDAIGLYCLNAVGNHCKEFLFTGVQRYRYRAWVAIHATCEWLSQLDHLRGQS
jgi:hypothetical protein